MSVIDLNEVREARQEIADCGNKIEEYFSQHPASDAELELLNDISSGDWAKCRTAVSLLEMIVDGEITAGYEDGKLILTRTEKLLKKLQSKSVL